MTIDDLARRADVPTSTVRMYQNRRLLPPSEKRGRVGYYGAAHLARLRLISRLQADGHSLAGIADLLGQWEQGRSLDAVVGVESGLEALTGESRAIELDASDLLARFPAGAMTQALLLRATDLGLVAAAPAGRVRVADRRFLETGSALAGLGVPIEVILDEWEALLAATDGIAHRFVAVFETHLAPEDWRTDLDGARATELATTLAELQATARTVLGAAFDASLARLARERLGDLIDAAVR
jgi:DNA-binding transcriptional MerR regulator